MDVKPRRASQSLRIVCEQTVSRNPDVPWGRLAKPVQRPAPSSLRNSSGGTGRLK